MVLDDNESPYRAIAVLARNYCATLNTAVDQTAIDLLPVEASLLDLYVAATRLPQVTTIPAYNRKTANPKHVPVSQQEWQALYSQLGDRLPFNEYRDSFDPLSATDREFTYSSLADDLADIWRDMAKGLRRLDSGVPAGVVWWEWRFSFYTHWGAHAAGALRAVYHFRRSEQ